MKILSFDCGIKTLSFSIINFNFHDLYNFLENNELTKDNIILYNNKLSESIKLENYGIISLLLKDEKIKESSILSRGKKLGEELKKIVIDNVDIILIEYQMIQNPKSRSIQDQIMMYYIIMHPNIKICVVGPSLKNKICLTKDGKHNLFLAKYSQSWTANKCHSAYNFNILTKILKWDIKNIKKEELHNLADSCLQTMAFIKYKWLLT